MRRLEFVVPAVLAAALALTTAAFAQGDYYYGFDETRKPLSVHAGVGFLSDDTKSDTVLVVGLEYEVPFTVDRTGTESYVTFGVDYVPIETLSTGREHVVPLLLGYKKYGIMGGYRVYFQAGAGARWASDDIPELKIGEGFQFEWALTAGVNITRNFLAEFRYLAGSHPEEDGIFTIGLGYRF